MCEYLFLFLRPGCAPLSALTIFKLFFIRGTLRAQLET